VSTTSFNTKETEIIAKNKAATAVKLLCWDVIYSLVVDFKEEFGHFRIPKRYTTVFTTQNTNNSSSNNDKKKDDAEGVIVLVRLGRWADNQQTLYARKMRGEPLRPV
jgi:hypothetical protein